MVLAEAAGAGAVLIFDTSPVQVTAILAVPGPFENPRTAKNTKNTKKKLLEHEHLFVRTKIQSAVRNFCSFSKSFHQKQVTLVLVFGTRLGRIPGYLISRSQGEELLSRLDAFHSIQTKFSLCYKLETHRDDA